MSWLPGFLSPLPGSRTFDARPEAVFAASAGGAATSGGAGRARRSRRLLGADGRHGKNQTGEDNGETNRERTCLTHLGMVARTPVAAQAVRRIERAFAIIPATDAKFVSTTRRSQGAGALPSGAPGRGRPRRTARKGNPDQPEAGRAARGRRHAQSARDRQRRGSRARPWAHLVRTAVAPVHSRQPEREGPRGPAALAARTGLHHQRLDQGRPRHAVPLAGPAHRRSRLS